jgi:hypothetical protein
VVRRAWDVLSTVDGALDRDGEHVNSHSKGVDWWLEDCGMCLALLMVR